MCGHYGAILANVEDVHAVVGACVNFATRPEQKSREVALDIVDLVSQREPDEAVAARDQDLIILEIVDDNLSQEVVDLDEASFLAFNDIDKQLGACDSDVSDLVSVLFIKLFLLLQSKLVGSQFCYSRLMVAQSELSLLFLEVQTLDSVRERSHI